MIGSQPLTPSFSAAKGEAHVPTLSKAERVLARCEAHFEKHRDQWTAKRYGELLVKKGIAPALRPVWAIDDSSAHLFRTAKVLVEHKQKMRLNRINRIASRMRGLDPDNSIGR
jgi:hypothetical protein